MGIVITKGTNIAEIVVEDGLSINKTKRMSIWKSDVVKLRLVDVPEMLDIVKVYYTNGDVDELHFTIVTSVEGEAPTDNLDLYNKLKVLFDA